MPQPAIAILMSCYNGASYLPAQLSSIFQQTYPHFTLYVRDDGSTDDTAAVLSSCADSRMRFLHDGKRLGYPQCFYALLREADDADYYAFSDQDDIWMPEKLEQAVAMLEQAGGSDRPLLYFCATHKGDESARPVGVRRAPEELGMPAYPYLCSPAPGFAMVFTKALRAQAVPLTVGLTQHHDRFLCRCAYAFGQILYDDTPLAIHRGHSASFSARERQASSGGSRARSSIWRTLRGENAEFAERAGDLLSAQKKKELLAFARTGKWARVFYPKRLRRGLGSEWKLRKAFISE